MNTGLRTGPVRGFDHRHHASVSSWPTVVHSGELPEDDVNQLIAAFQEHGDHDARDAIMEAFDWLAVACARRMRRRSEPVEDLEQVAREGLLGAIQRFDASRGVHFKSFAWATVLGVLRHHYRAGWQIRVPRGLQELHLAVVGATETLTAISDRSPTIAQLAAYLGAEPEDVILARHVGHAYRADSVDGTAAGEPVSIRGERAFADVDAALESVADRIEVRELLAALPKVQQTILVMAFFEGRTQSEIGECLGVSQVHVSRLMRGALADLRERLDPVDELSRS